MLKLQARVRGVIVREKITNGVGFESILGGQMKFIPTDPYGTYKPSKDNKVVSQLLLNIYFHFVD